MLFDGHICSQVTVIANSGYKSVISFRINGESTNRLPTDPKTGSIGNHEFEDANGNYAVALEKAAFEAQHVRFLNFPVSETTYFTTDSYYQMAPALAEAAALGPVFGHCAVRLLE